jgi:uncharacterized FlaG/YvyC family protein
MKRIIRLTESDLIKLVKRVIKEQKTYEKGGYSCEEHKTHTVCSRKDIGGYVVRVFENNSMNEFRNMLPEKAIFQVAAKGWDELSVLFHEKKNKMLPGVDLPNPKEPEDLTMAQF